MVFSKLRLRMWSSASNIDYEQETFVRVALLDVYGIYAQTVLFDFRPKSDLWYGVRLSC